MESIFQQIAKELNIKQDQVVRTVNLFDTGSTVPFVARYRKEVTGGLDDNHLRKLDNRLSYLRELEERKNIIIKTLEEQNKITPSLLKSIQNVEKKIELEELYLPYKTKRRTKGQIAIDSGLEPLANTLFEQPENNPIELAKNFINSALGVEDANSALEGARFILMERFSSDNDLMGELRQVFYEEGIVQCKIIEGKEKEGEKYEDYFSFIEKINKIPSHRVLAILRGRQQGILNVKIKLPNEPKNRIESHPCEAIIAQYFAIAKNETASEWLKEVVRWTWRVKFLPQLETYFFNILKEKADEDSINIFAKNLKDLLLAAPAGLRPTLGLDPGLRTGVKVVVVDATGKLVDYTTIHPHPPKREWKQAIGCLATLCLSHAIELVSIGNGTASRETDRLVSELMRDYPRLNLTKIVVSEAGASVYSASEIAANEFPGIDVSLRGAISIARRIQDPLAELVKIEPKAIGVGQYQHDVNQIKLSESLDAVVEDCVNAVGVDVNTASSALLTRVSGLNKSVADKIIAFRDQNGAFRIRKQLKNIERMGDKTYEQAIGFLRISAGDNPLDASSVHPESYDLVHQIAKKHNRDVMDIIGDSEFLSSLKAEDYVNQDFGLPTVTDIISELDKPGRDPRPEFQAPKFDDHVMDIKDLKLNMQLEGIVSNVTKFGAFIDIGVHQDGLVHISALTNKFVKDPSEVVKAGDIVKVKVMEVDVERKRISLSMRLDDQAQPPQKNASDKKRVVKQENNFYHEKNQKLSSKVKKPNIGSFGDLLANAIKKSK